MKLRELFESKHNRVAIIFGRFNPPHKGHKAAWQLAAKSPIWYVGTNQSTVGPKDPLPFEVKVECMKAIWPEVGEHIVAETSWLTLASKVYQDHGDVELSCLTDEEWVTKTIIQYNGKQGPHGFYQFSSIKQHPTPRLSSATALRDAVAKNDRAAFTHAAGVPADTPVNGHSFFDLVAHYLTPYHEKVAKKTRAKNAELAEAGFDREEFRRHMKALQDREDLRKTDPVAAKALDLRGQLPQASKKKHDDDSMSINDPRHPGWTYTELGSHHNVDETSRMSAQVKLQRAWEREQKKSAASSERGREYMAKIKEPKKDDKDVKEAGSDAIAHTAKRLTNPNDGKVAKLRAAGDKRRDDQLKYRDIARKERMVSERRSDYTPEEITAMLTGAKTQQQVDAEALQTRGPDPKARP